MPTGTRHDGLPSFPRPWQTIMNPCLSWTSRLTFCTLLLATSFAARADEPKGVPGRYHPLHQRSPLGESGAWALKLDPTRPGWFQPVQVHLPSSGRIEVYSGPARQPVPLNAESMMALPVGSFFRLRLSRMPEFPGVDVYPTVELLDRLHPPVDRELDFPVQIDFTERELEAALAGRLVTKVIYLEQPQLATPIDRDELNVLDYSDGVNLLAEADHRGRPMAIVRIGGRQPAVRGETPQFFGTGAPAWIPPNRIRPDQAPAQQPPADPAPAEPAPAEPAPAEPSPFESAAPPIP